MTGSGFFIGLFFVSAIVGFFVAMTMWLAYTIRDARRKKKNQQC